MNHGSINNYAYKADGENTDGSGGLLLDYAATQQPRANLAKHLPYLSKNNTSSPPANGDKSSSPTSQTNFLNNFFGSSYDLSKNGGLAQQPTAATATSTAKHHHRHHHKHATAFSSSSPSRMADAGEQPVATDSLSHNEALQKLRQKLGTSSATHVTSQPINNEMLLHDIPDYNTRFPQYSVNNIAAGSNNVYNANNVNGNTNIRWTQPTITTMFADTTLTSPGYASSNNSRQSGGDNSRATEHLPLLPTTATNNKNSKYFPVASSKLIATTVMPTSSSGVMMQQPLQSNHQNSQSLMSTAKTAHHQSAAVPPKTTTTAKQFEAELTNEKLPQLCALANSLQSVSSASLINGIKHNNNNSVDYYQHSFATDSGHKENVEPVPPAKNTNGKRSSELAANDLPKLLSKLAEPTATTTRKRSMNEDVNAADHATDTVHCGGTQGCGVHVVPTAAAVETASSGINDNHAHQPSQHQQVSDETTIGTIQKKSRFRIGSLAVNRKASVVAADAPLPVIAAVAPQQHQPAHTLPALHTTAVHHHAAKTSNENFESINIPASSSSGHNSLLSSSSKIGVDDNNDQQQLSPRNRVMSPNSK